MDKYETNMDSYVTEEQKMMLEEQYPLYIIIGCSVPANGYFEVGDSIDITTDGDINGEDIIVKWDGRRWIDVSDTWPN